MRKFLSRRFLGIPVVLTLLVGLMLVGGVAYATSYYTFFNGGTSTVHVNEPITWQCTAGDGTWDNATGVWNVSMCAGESKTLTLQLNNASSVVVPIGITITGPTSGDPVVSSAPSGGLNVPASGNAPVVFTAAATTSCPPGDYTFTITMFR
jgi:hypothetical protein